VGYVIILTLQYGDCIPVEGSQNLTYLTRLRTTFSDEPPVGCIICTSAEGMFALSRTPWGHPASRNVTTDFTKNNVVVVPIKISCDVDSYKIHSLHATAQKIEITLKLQTDRSRLPIGLSSVELHFIAAGKELFGSATVVDVIHLNPKRVEKESTLSEISNKRSRKTPATP
jgi:hypothetical protein